MIEIGRSYGEGFGWIERGKKKEVGESGQDVQILL